jgi:hypothetical protein
MYLTLTADTYEVCDGVRDARLPVLAMNHKTVSRGFLIMLAWWDNTLLMQSRMFPFKWLTEQAPTLNT